MQSTNDNYANLLHTALLHGETVIPRGMRTKELMNHVITVDMAHPVITIPERKLNYPFMAAEAYWILSGSRNLEDLTKYCKRMADFSDDGKTLAGAYGPKFVEQIQYVVTALQADTCTRQAVMTFWERNPFPSKDIPCTVMAQFMIRDGALNMTVCMRSQDVWLGVPYDIFSFSMMAYYVALRLLPQYSWLNVGKLSIFAGSRHIYERDVDSAHKLIQHGICGDKFNMSIHDFSGPAPLLNDLACASNAKESPDLRHGGHITEQFQSLCR